jgi:hypothetical protein
MRISLRCAVLLAFFAAVPAFGQIGPDVLVLGADDALYQNDVRVRLESTSLFGSVTVVDARSTTPTLQELQSFDAVLTWSNWDYGNAVQLGDTLADYVDAGGGVVVATFANSEPSATRYLGGRWQMGNYEVIVDQSGYHGGAASMGVVHQPAHPLMAGVTAFDGGSLAYRANATSLTAGAQSIADWTDNTSLVATHGTLQNRVDLNFFPPSNAVDGSSWLLSSDGARLLGNAVLYVAGGAGNFTVYCSGDGTATACPCGNAGAADNGCASSVSASGANLAGTGATSLSNDSAVLHGTLMPNSSALYYQGTTRTAAGLGTVFGDGLRCASGTIIRLKTKVNSGGASQFPGAGDPSLSVRGGVTVPGTRTYQVWYRNAAAYCGPSTFNLTNGLEVSWGG